LRWCGGRVEVSDALRTRINVVAEFVEIFDLTGSSEAQGDGIAGETPMPQPAPPHTSVGRPRGNPPPVISSRPWMPVGHLGKQAAGAVAMEPLVFIQAHVYVNASKANNPRA
jgi:hypothetical protein